MQHTRRKDTKPEIALRRLLHGFGLRYRLHVRPLPNLRCAADIHFRTAKVAVFVDGCFWHGCPSHLKLTATNQTYWTAKIARNKERDREFSRRLTAAGWAVLRFWEHADPEVAAEKVFRTVTTRMRSN
ncbi:MAG TPA: very short patch repair endonuclease [Candidatus Binatia bacterium]|nr:very short patch repair endonuclease [Candidatus Binatia bacterium]